MIRHSQFRDTLAALLVVSGLCACGSRWAGGAETISVELASGRTFTGSVDARTSARQLWLRSGGGRTVVLRPLNWDRITQVHTAAENLSAVQLQQRLTSGKWPKAETPFVDEPEKPTTQQPVNELLPPFPGIEAQMPPPGRVRSLYIEASISNWDSDVEADGLAVHVFPLDEFGAIVPTRAVLEAELIDVRQTDLTRGQPITQLGRWSRNVLPEDVGPAGAVFRLPFQAAHPEFDLNVGSSAILHARLTVPGQGTFEASADTVRIRPYSALRDRLQQLRGTRWLPEERTGRPTGPTKGF